MRKLIITGEGMSPPSFQVCMQGLTNSSSSLSNAGLFLWIDLSPYLEPHLDSWEAESKLSKRINEVGVVMSMGASYHEEKAGWFRVIFSLEEGKLWEGLRRYVFFFTSSFSSD